jgi:hypothetical protein
MVGRASGRSSVAGGIDTGTMRARLRSHSEACAVGAGDNTKVPGVGKATVGQGACCYKVVVAQSRGQPAQLTGLYASEEDQQRRKKKTGEEREDSCVQGCKVKSLQMDNQQ